jgi:hypothetical protein
MSEESQSERAADGVADAIAATAVIALVVFATFTWLSGMPS